MQNNEPMKSVLGAWAKFKKLPYGEQLKIRNEWEEYFKKVQETTIYALFQEQNKAFKENNFARVKELAEQAREMRLNGHNITLVKPKHIDPWEFDNGSIVQAYKNLDKAIKELTDYPIDEAAAEVEAENAQAFL